MHARNARSEAFSKARGAYALRLQAFEDYNKVGQVTIPRSS